jgi:hypothetical protein
MALMKDARLNWLRHKDWAWQDAVFGGMILASVAGLIYMFIDRIIQDFLRWLA